VAGHLDLAEYRRWSVEADLQLRGARRDGEAGDHSLASFRSEQAAQLALKAVLRGIGQPGWGHDLVMLIAAAAGRLGGDLADPDLDEAAKRLSVHYIASRYPDAFAQGTAAEHYSASIASAALADAEAITAACRRAWDALESEDG
jgi:HEPN domain-containing protein